MDGGNPTATLDDVIASLSDLVDVAKVGQTVAAASQATLASELADLHKTLAALPGDIALEHDIARGAREDNGVVSAFDRPQPVIVVGPKPLQVSIVGGLPGQSGPGQPPKPPTPKEDEPGFFGRLWQRSRFGRAGADAQKSVGGFFGGKGKSGLEGLGGAGQGAGAAQGLAGAARMASRAAVPVAVAVEAANALNEFRKAVIQATDEQIASAQKLAQFSGSMAAVLGQRESQEVLRSVRQGEAQSGSAGHLVASEQRRKNASEKLENMVENFKNDTLSTLNDLMVPLLEGISDAMQVMAKNSSRSAGEELGRMAGERWRERHGIESPVPAGIGADMDRVEREAKRIEDEANRMMDAASARAAKSGYATPPGARLP